MELAGGLADAGQDAQGSWGCWTEKGDGGSSSGQAC